MKPTKVAHTAPRAEFGCTSTGNPIKIVKLGRKRVADEMKSDVEAGGPVDRGAAPSLPPGKTVPASLWAAVFIFQVTP